MNKLGFKQFLLPIIVSGIICLMYFGPITRTVFENVILSIIIIIASGVENKKTAFSALGFYRDKITAKNSFLIAPITAFGLFVFYVAAIVPFVETLSGIPIDYSSMHQLRGDLPLTFIWLVIVWITAGFGEEIIFRGYLMRQFVKFFGESKISLAVNILLFSSFFGYMHMQQGITGQIVAATTGALLSLLFYLRKYDLWFNIMVHGYFNTLGLFSFYFGLA